MDRRMSDAGSGIARVAGVLAAACLLWAVQVAPGQLRSISENLAANPSFEDAAPGPKNAMPLPDKWSGDAAVYSRDATMARTGKASLKYVNADAGRYRLCAQRVPVQAGWKCRFSVWVKTRALAGEDSGATICMEWSGKDGQWLGGAYPGGVKGTRDWTRIEGVTRVPKEAASVTLTCYVREGVTGTAWFDDVQLVRVADPPVRSILLSPLYRGRITAAGPAEARVRVRLNLADYNLRPQDLKLQADITTPKFNRAFGEATVQPEGPGAPGFDLAIPVKDLPVGSYSLSVRLIGPDGKALYVTSHPLVRVADGDRPRCLIDEHRRLLVDGKGFFPIGMYWSSINEADIKVYADSKFNCLMPYGSPTLEQMDLAARHGLKVIYSVKDFYAGSSYPPGAIKTAADEEPAVRGRVRQFRDHPALLAWYLNDELPQSYMPRLEAHHQWVAQEDPNHPTWVVLYQVREVADYVNTFDVIGTDPYPIGRHPASMAADWTAETFRQVERARPMWQVPQLHNWANYDKSPDARSKGRTPTFDEKRSMAWQCICQGATGLVFYSWYDVKRNPDVPFQEQWQGLRKIAAEVDRMSPILLDPSEAPKVTAAPRPDKPQWLHWLARRHEGKLYLFTVNDGDAEGKATFTVSGKIKGIRLLTEGQPPAAQSGGFQDAWRKLEVRVYEVEPGD